MSSGLEAEIALDAAVVLSLGTNRILGAAGKLTAAGAQALAAIAEGRAETLAAALAEARRHEQAVRDVLDRNARIAALSQSAAVHGVVDVPVPVPLDPASLPVDELASWAARIDPVLTEAEARVSRYIAATSVAAIFQLPVAALRTDLGTPPRTHSAAAADPHVASDSAATARPDAAEKVRRGRAEMLVRVLGRLAADTAEADRVRVQVAATRVGVAPTEAEAEGLLSEVRLRVQTANARTTDRRAAAARAAAEREAAEQAAAERAYLLDAVTGAFGELGYQVDEGFETLTAKDGTVVLSKDDWPDHAIKMRVDDAAHIRAALVRTVEPAGEEERRVDVERETEWCAAFEAARRLLGEAGVRSDVRWRIDPGEQRLPVAPEARQTRTRSKLKERQRELER